MLPSFLPPLDSPQPNPQPVSRPRRNPRLDLNFPLRILQLHLKPARQSRHQHRELGLRKRLPDATPRPVQEGQERVIARRASRVRLPGTKPTFGVEGAGVRAPEFPGLVHGAGAEDDSGAGGDVLAADRRGLDGLSECERDGGVQAEDFVAHGVQEGEAIEGFCRDRGRGVD